MAVIETGLTILGLGADITGLYSWFTGLKTGNEMHKFQQELGQNLQDC
jgi:hypothetical protein